MQRLHQASIILLLLLVLSAGCADRGNLLQGRPVATATVASGNGSPQQPVGLRSAQVVKVVDGDTLDVQLGGETVRLRLIGLDTPETVDPRKPVQCFGREASAHAHTLLDGQIVQLEADASQDERDKYDRLLRYVWLPDGRLYNYVMIAQGYAHEYTYDLPYKYQALFKEAERQAREDGRGLWGASTCAGDTSQPAESQGTATVTATPAVPFATPIPGQTGIRVVKEPGTVNHNQVASVTVQTVPGAECSITVRYKSGPSTGAGLEPKTADGAGMVSWSWTIGQNTTAGTWPVTIACAGQTAGTSVTIP